MKKSLFIAIAVCLLCGCATTGSQHIVDDAKVAQIQKGASTKEDVRLLLGAPTKVDFTDAGFEVWEYVYSKSQTRATSFLPYVGGVVGGSDSITHTLTVQFTDEGIVKNVGRGKVVGKGGSVFD